MRKLTGGWTCSPIPLSTSGKTKAKPPPELSVPGLVASKSSTAGERRQCRSSVCWEGTDVSLQQLPPSLRLPSYTFLLLHFPPSLSLRSHLSFCPAQIFNFHSGVLSFRSVVVFLSLSSLFVWFLSVCSLSAGHRKERDREWFLRLGNGSWEHWLYWGAGVEDTAEAEGA